MAIKFGEIDATQILENEYRIGILEHVVNIIIQRAPGAAPTNEEMAQIKNVVIKQLQDVEKVRPRLSLRASGGI